MKSLADRHKFDGSHHKLFIGNVIQTKSELLKLKIHFQREKRANYNMLRLQIISD